MKYVYMVPWKSTSNKRTNFQRRFSVNVWCGLVANKLIGPFVLDNSLTGNTYVFS